MKKKTAHFLCPCGSTQPYLRCCARWHSGPEHLQAPDAHALMRSRYSAFVLDLRDYLLATWHSRTRPAQIDAPEPGLKWLGLQILACEAQDSTHACVEFIARYKPAIGPAQRLHERSRFNRADGQWYYVDGDILEP